MDVEMAAKSTYIKARWEDYIIGIVALSTAYMILRIFCIKRIKSILSKIKSKFSTEIDDKELSRAWVAIYNISFFFGGRTACMEFSLSLLIFSLIKGKYLTWCIGIATDPFESHAWIEIKKIPFNEEKHLKQRQYKKILSV